MTISDRARFNVTEMPEHERPLSEQYRLVAKVWVDAEKAAAILEESKSAVLSQMMLAKGDVPVSKAEMQAKGSPEWQEYLDKMVSARAEANLRKVQMKYIEMRFSEWQSGDANQRAERRMSR
jgi:hypothetical protein